MIVKTFVEGPIETNTYLVIDNEKKNGVIIDPEGNGNDLIEEIKSLGITLKAILVTHGHFDHVGAIKPIKEVWDVPVITHIEESKMMEDASLNGSMFLNQNRATTKADRLVIDNDILDFGNDLKFSCFIVPGHTSGSVCYYNEEGKVVFSGDTLFADTIGRTDLYDGPSDDLQKNIKKKLLVLPDETTVYPGHGSSTTIKKEKISNPYL